jgi:hypothetical protein
LKFKTKSFEKLIIYFSNFKVLLPLIWIIIFLFQNPKYSGLIPNPINTTKIDFKPLEIEDKIIIFHGINKQITIKGNDFFEKH